MAAVRLKVRAAAFTGREEETAPFTFTWTKDREGRPIVGNGSDHRPFVVGVTTKRLLRQADRDPDSFILHVDATYKLTQVGYPVVVVGITDRARQFHLLGIFIVSQEQEAQYTEVLSMLCQMFTAVTGKPLQVTRAMGDADRAQWNALNEAFGGPHKSFQFLMCYFHVAKKIYEKTRAFDSSVSAMIMRYIHELHFSRSDEEFQERLTAVLEEWDKWDQLAHFKTYFSSVWLNYRVWRWQCYSPSGFAATNNPCETYNAAIKRDITLRRRLKVGALLDQLLILCRAESVRVRPFQTAAAYDDRLVRRSNALARTALLYECRPQHNSINFLLGNVNTENSDVVKVFALPAPRGFNVVECRSREDLPVTAQMGTETARMEYLGMPTTGWEVDVAARTCPCRVCWKQGCCVHVLYALRLVGNMDLPGRDTLVYRGNNKRKRTSQPAGQPRLNGPALSTQ